jgi:hypothetical protein
VPIAEVPTAAAELRQIEEVAAVGEVTAAEM